jgi:3-oxoacyl-[acyl-carrier protein] reductase
MEEKLLGKVALITGGARGLGRAYALRLAKLGADIAVFDINLRSFEEYELEKKSMFGETVVEEIKKLGRKALGIEVDVSNFKAVCEAVDKVVDEFKRIDILVCNAGVGTGPFSGNRASEINYDDLHKTMDRNLFATIYTCIAVAKYMKRQRYGKIVTVASQAGVMPRSGAYAHYGVAKAGIIMYTRYLAYDLAPYGITVNCIAPGFIATGQWLERNKREGTDLDALIKTIPMGRLGTPEDCAKVVEFLCTDLSDYVTGQVIGIDGGTVLAPH